MKSGRINKKYNRIFFQQVQQVKKFHVSYALRNHIAGKGYQVRNFKKSRQAWEISPISHVETKYCATATVFVYDRMLVNGLFTSNDPKPSFNLSI